MKYQEAKSQGKAAPAPQLTQEQMKGMIERAKQFKPKERKV
jgi:hypothetical protein